MTFLPIVERELRVAARLTGTYKRRAVVATIVALVSMVMLVFAELSESPWAVGAVMFGTLSWLLLGFCVLEGVRKTADCLSEERREGTLGLLFLTDLKGYDIVLGKLAATSLPSIYGLLAMLPMLGLSLLLGGVTQGEFWRVSLALVNILFFSLSAGLWVSARSTVNRRAVAGTLLLLLLCLGGPLLARGRFFSHLSPIFAFFDGSDLDYRNGGVSAYWHSIASGQVLSWLLLGWAAFAATRIDENDGGSALQIRLRERWRRWEFGDSRMRAEVRTEMLRINPAYWLAGRSMGRLFFWICLGVVVLSYAAIPFIGGWSNLAVAAAVAPLVINFFVKMFMAAQACHCLAEARANQAMEMLLSTPLKAESILEGQILALKRTFAGPIAILITAELLGYYVLILISSAGNTDVAAAFMGVLTIGAFLGGIFGLDLMAVTWVGMWFGLASKNETHAVFKTILYVLLIPVFFLIFYCFAIPFMIAWPIVCTVLAREKLRSQFRRLATARFSPVQDSGWWPLQTAAQPPPRDGR